MCRVVILYERRRNKFYAVCTKRTTQQKFMVKLWMMAVLLVVSFLFFFLSFCFTIFFFISSLCEFGIHILTAFTSYFVLKRLVTSCGIKKNGKDYHRWAHKICCCNMNYTVNLLLFTQIKFLSYFWCLLLLLWCMASCMTELAICFAETRDDGLTLWGYYSDLYNVNIY